MSEQKVTTEEFKLDGDQIISKIKDLIKEGNLRRVIITNDEGRTRSELPLTLGLVGTILAPQLAALGAIAVLIGHGALVVEKVED